MTKMYLIARLLLTAIAILIFKALLVSIGISAGASVFVVMHPYDTIAKVCSL